MEIRACSSNSWAELCNLGSIVLQIFTEMVPGVHSQESAGSLSLEPEITIGTIGSLVWQEALKAPI